MGFASALVLVMLTLVGYSGGTVAAAKGRLRTPLLLDLLLVVVLWVVLFAARDQLGRWWTLLVAVVFSALAGAVFSLFLRRSLPVVKEMPVEIPAGASIFRAIWLRWAHFSHRLGDFQGRLLMAFVYFLVVTPFGIGMRLFGDPLGRKKGAARGWHEFHNTSQTLDESMRQF
jgi:hypothetical protein